MNVLSFTVGDRAYIQYCDMLEHHMKFSHETFVGFKGEECRLDEFFFSVLKVGKKYPDISLVIKFILVLSPAQGSVERGFNITKMVSKTNLKEDSFIARKFIIDYLNAKQVEPHEMVMNQQSVKSVKASRQRYEIYL